MIAGLVAGGLVVATALALVQAVLSRPGRYMHLRRLDDESASAPQPPRWFASRLASAPVEARRAWTIWLGGFAALALAGIRVAGLGLALLLAALWSCSPLLAGRLLERRARARREEAVPLVLDSVARALRSGASLPQALGEAAGEPGPLQVGLRELVAEAERGAGITAALDSWADRSPGGSVRLAAAALSLGAEMGGASARTVEGVAATVRQRLAVAGETRALTSQARSSAWVIALAPVGFCALAAATDPQVARLLFTRPIGWLMLALGLALDLAGARWMAAMARA